MYSAASEPFLDEERVQHSGPFHSHLDSVAFVIIVEFRERDAHGVVVKDVELTFDEKRELLPLRTGPDVAIDLRHQFRSSGARDERTRRVSKYQTIDVVPLKEPNDEYEKVSNETTTTR